MKEDMTFCDYHSAAELTSVLIKLIKFPIIIAQHRHVELNWDCWNQIWCNFPVYCMDSPRVPIKEGTIFCPFVGPSHFNIGTSLQLDPNIIRQ